MSGSKQKKSKPRAEPSPPVRSSERDRVDRLLDEALEGTFPASDPVTIGGDRRPDGDLSKRR